MQRNKYLDDLGIKIENYGANFVKENKIQRFIERKKYGFDYRQIINMDLSFAEWLYSRLMMFMEQTMADLTFHIVDFEGERYTIEQAINRILNATREYLYYYEERDLNGEDISKETVTEICNEMKVATRLWTEIMPYVQRVVCNKSWLQ